MSIFVHKPDRSSRPVGFSIGLLLFSLMTAAVADGQPKLAPGYGILEFTAPEAGSYRLSVLGEAGDGEVLDSNNQPQALHELMGDKLVVLSFIYSTCSDANGCPLATMVLHRVKKRLLKEPEIAKQLRLLTLSFNPEHDTPERMRQYGQKLRDDNLEWHFLTTKSEKSLQPILQNYRQNIQKVYAENGRFTGTFSHILRVYLIDKDKKLRNIYSVDFLHADTLVNDIKTLLLPEIKATQTSSKVTYSAGDNRQGYQDKDYRTENQALSQRKGQPANLLAFIKKPSLGLPKVPEPLDNPATAEKISLGRKLFYDRRLSLNNTFSCAMCHVPEQGFTSNEMATSVGFEGRSVRRNAPTLYNVAYMEKLFHDGRENTLEQQVWGPFLAANEMANPSIGHVVEKIKNSRDYDGLFEQAFKRGVGMETIGMALASYQRSLNSADSPFDRWHFGGEKNALSDSAKRGFKLFNGKAGCVQCHSIGEKTALFTDQQLHNTGLGYDNAMAKTPEHIKIQLAPGVFIDVDSETVEQVSEPKGNDLGLYEVTQNPDDRWKYKTPGLRNIALTAPYMHDGRFQSLKKVIDFYNQGGIANSLLDPLIKPLGLDDAEKEDLIAFLMSLTGSNVETLVSDAFAAPIGEPE